MGSRFNPLSAPYHYLRGRLQRISDPRLRAVASFALLFAISLAIGRTFEIVLSDENVKAAEKVQAGWVASLQSFAPLALIRGYADDVGAVMRGDMIYEPPPPPPPPLTAEQIAEIDAVSARLSACNLALMRPRCPIATPGGLPRSHCLVNPEDPGCAELNACSDFASESLFNTPPECEGVDDARRPFSWTERMLQTSAANAALNEKGAPTLTPFPGEYQGKRIPVHLAPLFAVARSITRIIGENGVAPFIAFGQLALGVLSFCAITSAVSNGARIGFDGFWPNLLLAPACIVALASVSALLMQWLMIGALSAFSWATSLAAACCGTTSLGAACWYCLKKLGETGVQHALTGGR
ncbi:MAG: hypothetical protein ACOZAA_02530 [Pseudomonadota bacterium]